MSNVIQLPVIAGIEITTDAEGRFNLNALHKASGAAKGKAPNEWLRTQQARDLADELKPEIPGFRNVESKPGRYGGTFAHELLAISYAGWISPAFQLKVNQVFLDYRSGKLSPASPPTNMTRLEILQLAMEAERENIRLTAQVEELSPKADALDRIASSDGGMCITNAAKDLQMRPKDLFAWLSANQWIYRRAGGSGWVAHQDRIQSGHLEHKVTTVLRSDGSEKTAEQVLVTPKGLTKLAHKLGSAAA